MPLTHVILTVKGSGPSYSRHLGISSDEALWQEIEIVTATTDEALAIGGVATIDLFFLVATQAVSLRFAASGTSITVDANKPILLSGTNLTTAPLISNSSGSTAVVTYAVAGT